MRLLQLELQQRHTMSTESVELQRVRGRQLLLAFALGLVFFILRRQLYESTWVPMGADWDVASRSSVLAFRWFLPHGSMAALWFLCGCGGLFFTHAPSHFCAAFVNGVYCWCSSWVYWILGRLFLGRLWAWLGWFFCLTFPLNMSFAEWCSSYALWGCACVWTVISMFEYHQSKQLKWAFGMEVRCGI